MEEGIAVKQRDDNPQVGSSSAIDDESDREEVMIDTTDGDNYHSAAGNAYKLRKRNKRTQRRRKNAKVASNHHNPECLAREIR